MTIEPGSKIGPYEILALIGAGGMGEMNRAEELIQKLMPGEAYGAPMGLCHYYFLSGEIDRVADWLEKAIEQRHPLTPCYLRLYFVSSSRWPALARLMNLPEEAR